MNARDARPRAMRSEHLMRCTSCCRAISPAQMVSAPWSTNAQRESQHNLAHAIESGEQPLLELLAAPALASRLACAHPCVGASFVGGAFHSSGAFGKALPGPSWPHFFALFCAACKHFFRPLSFLPLPKPKRLPSHPTSRWGGEEKRVK